MKPTQIFALIVLMVVVRTVSATPADPVPCRELRDAERYRDLAASHIASSRLHNWRLLGTRTACRRHDIDRPHRTYVLATFVLPADYSSRGIRYSTSIVVWFENDAIQNEAELAAAPPNFREAIKRYESDPAMSRIRKLIEPDKVAISWRQDDIWISCWPLRADKNDLVFRPLAELDPDPARNYCSEPDPQDDCDIFGDCDEESGVDERTAGDSGAKATRSPGWLHWSKLYSVVKFALLKPESVALVGDLLPEIDLVDDFHKNARIHSITLGDFLGADHLELRGQSKACEKCETSLTIQLGTRRAKYTRPTEGALVSDEVWDSLPIYKRAQELLEEHLLDAAQCTIKSGDKRGYSRFSADNNDYHFTIDVTCDRGERHGTAKISLNNEGLIRPPSFGRFIGTDTIRLFKLFDKHPSRNKFTREEMLEAE